MFVACKIEDGKQIDLIAAWNKNNYKKITGKDG
jgi:hypothetical protein